MRRIGGRIGRRAARQGLRQRRGRAKRAKTIQRQCRRQRSGRCRPRRRLLVAALQLGQSRQPRDAPQHVHEQPGQRQVRPVGICRDVEQHDPPLARFLRRHQGRAVGQPRPDAGAVRQQRRIGQHLTRDAHVLGEFQAEKRAVVLERGQRLRRAPGKRPAERAPAGAQIDREKVVAALFQARAGEADDEAAAPEEFVDRLARRPRDFADIGQHQHGAVSGGELGDGGGAVGLVRGGEFRERFEGALDIVKLAKQGLRGFAGCAGNQPDTVPARAGIQQLHRSGGALIANGEARDLVAQFERDFQFLNAAAGIGGQRHLRLAERLVGRRQRLNGDAARRAAGPQHAKFQRAASAQLAAQRQRPALGVGIDGGNRTGRTGDEFEFFSEGRRVRSGDAIR